MEAFGDEIEQATRERLDFKSELQERLARDGETVDYEVTSEEGPPHDRRFEVRATVDGDEIGVGSGRSKKEAEQAAAAACAGEVAQLARNASEPAATLPDGPLRPFRRRCI